MAALLDAMLCVKLDNRFLAMALEEGRGGSPYQGDQYEWWHGLLRSLLERIPGVADGDFTAHALLAATRDDLAEYLAGGRGVPGEGIRAKPAGFVAGVLGSRPAYGSRPPSRSGAVPGSPCGSPGMKPTRSASVPAGGGRAGHPG